MGKKPFIRSNKFYPQMFPGKTVKNNDKRRAQKNGFVFSGVIECHFQMIFESNQHYDIVTIPLTLF